jgi:hypothetical protein
VSKHAHAFLTGVSVQRFIAPMCQQHGVLHKKVVALTLRGKWTGSAIQGILEVVGPGVRVFNVVLTQDLSREAVEDSRRQDSVFRTHMVDSCTHLAFSAANTENWWAFITQAVWPALQCVHVYKCGDEDRAHLARLMDEFSDRNSMPVLEGVCMNACLPDDEVLLHRLARRSWCITCDYDSQQRSMDGRNDYVLQRICEDSKQADPQPHDNMQPAMVESVVPEPVDAVPDDDDEILSQMREFIGGLDASIAKFTDM